MNEILQERVKSFASLRAAQRALARCMHPIRVAAVGESGRQLLIELQAFGDSAEGGGKSGPVDPEDEGRLERIDGLLAHQIGSTLEIVADLDFAQLRATGPKLCAQYPEEVRALIDVMLMGDLTDGPYLTVLEFLITMVCTEEWNGRRTVVHDPSEVTPGLRAMAARDAARNMGEVVAKLEVATSSLSGCDDHFELRNEIRSFKRGLGADLLRSDVLSRVVGYNVAMWNHVAAGVDSSMAIDQLADEVLADFQEIDGSETSAPLGDPTGSTRDSVDLLSSAEFERVIEALRARIIGEACDDAVACRVAAGFDLSSLRPLELETLEGSNSDLSSKLIRKAVVLSQIIRNRREVEDALESLPIDAQSLETHCLDKLAEDMTTLGRKLFADSRYTQSFELSEVKTRHLAALCEDQLRRIQRESLGVGSRLATPLSDSRTSPTRRKRRFALGFGLPPAQLALVAGVILCIGVPTFWMPEFRESDALSAVALRSLSPFLASGERREIEGQMHFVGRVGATWHYLGTPERREVATKIAGRLRASGIRNYSLTDENRQILVLWRDGQPSEVIPKPGPG